VSARDYSFEPAAGDDRQLIYIVTGHPVQSLCDRRIGTEPASRRCPPRIPEE
jgi:hypothetical protein